MESFVVGLKPNAASAESGIPSPSVSVGPVLEAISPGQYIGDAVSSEMSSPDVPHDWTSLIKRVSMLSRTNEAPASVRE